MLRALEPGANSTPDHSPLRIPGAAARDTLRVAVDPFAEAEIRYKFLVDERRAGGLQPRAFRLAVRDLAVLDSEGRRWMLGPEDGIWYRRENERWLQADPPRRLVCPSCGHHNLGRHSFCVECGHRMDRWRRCRVARLLLAVSNPRFQRHVWRQACRIGNLNNVGWRDRLEPPLCRRGQNAMHSTPTHAHPVLSR